MMMNIEQVTPPQVRKLGQDAVDYYQERAAIGEYERGMTREESEAEALRLTIDKYGDRQRGLKL